MTSSSEDNKDDNSSTNIREHQIVFPMVKNEVRLSFDKVERAILENQEGNTLMIAYFSGESLI